MWRLGGSGRGRARRERGPESQRREFGGMWSAEKNNASFFSRPANPSHRVCVEENEKNESLRRKMRTHKGTKE